MDISNPCDSCSESRLYAVTTEKKGESSHRQTRYDVVTNRSDFSLLMMSLTEMRCEAQWGIDDNCTDCKSVGWKNLTYPGVVNGVLM
ncbi:hypothetical protein ACF0H5_005147 [Mactra antiquata]